MTDYSGYLKESADPEPSSMIETFRAIGYSIEAAIADVIDNSISANAGNIWVEFQWHGSGTWFAIKDDGHGMDNKELIQAMRPGSKSPLDERDQNDLGRFGMGLKSASFSQCRKLSVISKREGGESVFWTWDLDFVRDEGRWDLINYLPDRRFKDQLDIMKSGTIVIWNDIDRLVRNIQSDDKRAFEKFLAVLEQIKGHLAMVFHRFIESGKVKIYFQGREVDAWNPFLPNANGIQPFPEETVQSGQVKLKGYVLPHRSKIGDKKFEEAEGPGGWNHQQGFYIYRNQRLLMPGDWLGLFRKEELYKLARIQVDLPNNLDTEWQIDIKKSVARPPLAIRDQLKAYAFAVRSAAVEVFMHKGKTIQRSLNQAYQPVWLEKVKNGKRFYEINREHPVLRDVVSGGDRSLNPLLRVLEEALPIPLIVLKESENPDSFRRPFEDESSKEVADLMKVVYQALLARNGRDQAKRLLLLMEPFNEYPEIIESL